MFGFTELAIIALVVALVVVVPRLRQAPEALIDEAALGARELQQIRSEHPVVVCEEPVVTDVLNTFAQRAGLRVPRLRALIVQRPGLNAAALADGTVVLWTELVEAVAKGGLTRNELAGVVAHELAHIELGHGRQRAARELLARPFVSWLGLWGGGLLGGLVLNQGLTLLRKGASRQAELEADALALSLLRRSGFPADSLAHFLERLAKRSPEQPAWAAWASTHPHVVDRIRALRDATTR